MSEQRSRPVSSPGSPPPVPSPAGSPRPGTTPVGLDAYHTVAETVGFVPNIRLKDNIVQTVSVGMGLVGGAGAGAVIAAVRGGEFWLGATVGGVLGLIAATFLSGLVLMVLGWIRAARR